MKNAPTLNIKYVTMKYRPVQTCEDEQECSISRQNWWKTLHFVGYKNCWEMRASYVELQNVLPFLRNRGSLSPIRTQLFMYVLIFWQMKVSLPNLSEVASKTVLGFLNKKIANFVQSMRLIKLLNYLPCSKLLLCLIEIEVKG